MIFSVKSYFGCGARIQCVRARLRPLSRVHDVYISVCIYKYYISYVHVCEVTRESATRENKRTDAGARASDGVLMFRTDESRDFCLFPV